MGSGSGPPLEPPGRRNTGSGICNLVANPDGFGADSDLQKQITKGDETCKDADEVVKDLRSANPGEPNIDSLFALAN